MSIAAVVEQGRRLVGATFLDRCVVLDQQTVPDGSGGTTSTFVARATDVPCRFSQLMETDIRLIAGSAYGPATAVLQLPIAVDASEGSFVQNVAQDDAFWVIVGDRTPPSATAVYRRLMVREATWVA